MADIEFNKEGAWGVVTLNRPKALNALSHDMVKAFLATLLEWREDDAVSAVLVRSTSEKAFCAGGDIRWLADNAQEDIATAISFFRDEYTNNALIKHYPKPYVALLDGVTMGGGVGISVHGARRVAGEGLMLAMPETGIGLFPDVGGGYFLPRLKDGMGLYLGLTGARAKAADCVAIGVATHFTPSERHEELGAALLATPLASDDALSEIDAVLDAFAGDPGASKLAAASDDIATFFAAPKSLSELMKALEASSSAFAEETLKTLSRMSPLSMAITFEQLQRGAELSFEDVMKMEYRVVSRVMEGAEFLEGVRALIIDKDKSPKWGAATVEQVDAGELAAYFKPLGANELDLANVIGGAS